MKIRRKKMVRIVTDTASDITLNQAKQLNIELVPIEVMFGKESYEGIADENFEIFYKLLEESKDLPTTSQPSPATYLTLFTQAKTNGDELIGLTLSGGLSGTYQSACIAAQMADYNGIHVIDTRTVITGQRLLVELAVKLRNNGMPAQSIADYLEDAKRRVRLFGALDTLKYLRKGGRIPKSAEMLGTVMGIKPLIKLTTEGKIAMAGKTRGHAGAFAGMMKLIGEHSDFDPEAPFYFGYTLTSQNCQNFRKLAISKLHIRQNEIYPVGPVVGTHIGAGAFAVTYLTKSYLEE
jgi:DegV family protein with EDD domain